MMHVSVPLLFPSNLLSCFSTRCVESLHVTVGLLTRTAVGVGWQTVETF